MKPALIACIDSFIYWVKSLTRSILFYYIAITEETNKTMLSRYKSALKKKERNTLLSYLKILKQNHWFIGFTWTAFNIIYTEIEMRREKKTEHLLEVKNRCMDWCLFKCVYKKKGVLEVCLCLCLKKFFVVIKMLSKKNYPK